MRGVKKTNRSRFMQGYRSVASFLRSFIYLCWPILISHKRVWISPVSGMSGETLEAVINSQHMVAGFAVTTPLDFCRLVRSFLELKETSPKNENYFVYSPSCLLNLV